MRKSHRTGVSTFASRTSPSTDQSLQKSVPVPTQTEIQNIFPCPSKKIKTPDTQTPETLAEAKTINTGLCRVVANTKYK